MQNLRLVSSENIDHDLHDRLMHAKNSHQVWVLVEHFVIHDVPGEDKGENIHLKVLEVEGGRYLRSRTYPSPSIMSFSSSLPIRTESSDLICPREASRLMVSCTEAALMV